MSKNRQTLLEQARDGLLRELSDQFPNVEPQLKRRKTVLAGWEKKLRPIELEMREMQQEAERLAKNSGRENLEADYGTLLRYWRLCVRQCNTAAKLALDKHPPKTKGPSFDLVGGRLFLEGKWYSLSKSEKYVLRILVEKQAALFADLSQGNARPDRVLRSLLHKIPPAKKYIILPRKKGSGGYKTTIRAINGTP